MHGQQDEILNEIKTALEHSDYTQYDEFLEAILSARRIVTFGAGRVGLGLKGFAKRMGHLGLNSYFLEDSTVPRTTVADLLILGSGSGATPSVLTIANIAQQNETKVALIGATRNSLISEIAFCAVYLRTPSKNTPATDSVKSFQPMTTLFEQCLWIFLDGVVIDLMRILGETNESMKLRHNVLE